MLGQFIGQFLPLSGGPNFPMHGDLYIGGHNIAGGGTASFTTFNGTNFNGSFNGDLNLDASGSLYSNGSGNEEIAEATFSFINTSTDANAVTNNNNAGVQVQNNWTLSGANASTDLLVNRVVASGSSTGTQYLLDLQLNGTSELHIDTTGKATSSGGFVAAGSSGFVGASFRSGTFSANTTIFVDATNGSDNGGNGSLTNPYKTITKAASVAVSGNLIFVGSGTYTNNGQIILPSGVSLKGSGMDVTTLQPTGTWTAGLSALVVLGNSSHVSDLTIDLTNSPTANRTNCIGCNDSATVGTQFGVNPSLHRVKCKNTGTGLIYTSSSSGNTTNSYLYLEDCIFVSNCRCVQWIMSHATLTVDVFRCQFLFTYSSGVTNSNNGECMYAQASPTRLFDCLLSMTDTTNTSWSGLGYQCIDADNPLEVYGTHIITSFPNLPAVPVTTVAGTDVGWWAFSNTAVTKIGAGCTVNPPIQDIGQSLYQTLPSLSPHSYALSLAVASSTATPWSESGNNLFEVATDAGSLTSNTLTIANVAVGNNGQGSSVVLADCQKMRLRIKNTNSGSTAMTLLFGTSYNNAAFTVGTISAGKRAYLDFIYDGDNSSGTGGVCERDLNSSRSSRRPYSGRRSLRGDPHQDLTAKGEIRDLKFEI